MDFPPEAFNQWASGYDQETAQENGFPFAGYQNLLNAIIAQANAKPGEKVLDLGCGTGNLGALFLPYDCRVWGSDFAAEMLVIARNKYPNIIFAEHDLRQPLPQGFPQQYDVIVSAYVFHHFPIHEKINIISGLLDRHLKPNGRLLIGDLVFVDPAAREQTASRYVDQWDEEEYWTLSEDLPLLAEAGIVVRVEPVSFCASLLHFSR
ncbi:MAG: hypothetical protein CVU39_28135 [Chloroflexi bacterium HGW-Chloroflexi-10]|nr:MAG: hypothetical protein CVU39_28135 [Chloroflexi bacterium HGW-Chloroflexi-10]